MEYEDEPDCCPLCMEELDITDKTFNACPCGYQVCLWCWHQIKNEYNGLCPACRQPYAELSKQKNPLDREDVVRRTKQRKQKEKSDRRVAAQAKSATVNRKSLQNVRVMQRNLVYVIGLPVPFAEEDVLRSPECFGQYGKIVKAVVNKAHLNTDRVNATASAYITYANKDDALCCIVAIDGYYLDGSLLRASFGTTKYCNFFLRNMQCNNPDCLYLHELGDEDDSFTKEEMQSALHSGKAAFRDMSMANGQIQEREGSCFPPPHRPNAPTRTGSAASVRAPSPARGTTLVRSHSMEPYGDSQRHAQSAAAISKLRQAAGDSTNSSGSSSPDRMDRAAHNTEYPPLSRGHSYGNIVAGGHSSSSAASVPTSTATPGDPVPNKKRELRVDTSREEDATQVESVVGPLEALKMVTGSSTEQPAWAQPFPTPSIFQSESEEQVAATTTSNSVAGVYSPFGLGFEGGIRRANSARELTSKSPTSGAVWGSSNVSDSTLDSFPPAAPTLTQSTSSSSSFASIDAIFSQRNDSSEALAGLLGVQLAPYPLVHGASLAAPPKDTHTSRFSFANPADAGRDGMQTNARYELLDGTTNNQSSFGGFNAPRVGNAPSSLSVLPATTDRSGFPPLGSSQQLRHAPPPHPSRSSFGSSNELPLNGSSALGGESGGLAFLQQMLPNVNISFGGDYPSLSGGVDTTTTPSRSASAGRGRSPGRRLFERSQSAGGGLFSADTWDGGSLSSLGFDGQSSARRASSGSSSLHDPALAPQSSSAFSSTYYGFNSSSSMTSNDSESERLRLHRDFGGDAYRRPGSLINNS
ncbi:hypothetical protein PHMEG_0004299 [Phytophthora megakarya]|uniref:CCR4-NOT transcription complex subunit 4 n=1 Tax=Phytophthora megakarya TaxID=4795 RepID=A0A225WU26_9STRA|nr:hypothetical protein PHMEG_0004299 [Phytophthora megakarya]